MANDSRLVTDTRRRKLLRASNQPTGQCRHNRNTRTRESGAQSSFFQPLVGHGVGRNTRAQGQRLIGFGVWKLPHFTNEVVAGGLTSDQGLAPLAVERAGYAD